MKLEKVVYTTRISARTKRETTGFSMTASVYNQSVQNRVL
jgi:hypothetical protein